MSSKVFEHFVLPPSDNGNDSVKAKCKHCAACISGNLKTASNFMTHLKRKHRDVYLSLRLSTTPCSPGATNQRPLTEYVKPTAMYSLTDHRHIELTDSLVQYIASDLVPLSVVDSPFFKALVSKLDPRFQLPSRKHLSTHLLQTKSADVSDAVKTSLQKAPSICLAIDLWSNRQMKGFLGITGHFVEDWTLKTVMIACKRFKGRHTADNIRFEYEEAISKYDISQKILTIVTDNASNMTKAFDFSLVGYTTDTDESQPDIDEQGADIDPEKSHEMEEYLPSHSRCYAHTLQLVVKDGLNDASQHLKNVIAKASNIVTHVRKSLHATDNLDGEKRLQTATATRWNSQLIMIRSVLNIPDYKMKQLEVPQLTAYERKLLTELCSILSPFERATMMVQQSNNTSASLTIPVTLGLKHQMKQISSTYSNSMVTRLRTSIDNRLSHYEADQSYSLAALLDPRFKKRWCDKQTETQLTHELLQKAREVQPSNLKEEDTLEPPSKVQKPDDDLFSFMGQATSTSQVKSTAAELEIKEYLQQPCCDTTSDPLQYWKSQQTNFPILASLALKYLTIPASSAPVERLFSIAGKIFRPERCSMTDSTFEKLMMIKCNSHLLN